MAAQRCAVHRELDVFIRVVGSDVGILQQERRPFGLVARIRLVEQVAVERERRREQRKQERAKERRRLARFQREVGKC